MKEQFQREADLKENAVHEFGEIVVKPVQETEGILGWIFEKLGFTHTHIFKAEVEEAADWKAGDDIRITVENLSKGGK